MFRHGLGIVMGGWDTSMLMPSRSFMDVPPPSGSVADIWEMLLLRGGIVGTVREGESRD